MATVDSAQGKEYDFVILDLVTPGGREYPLGIPAWVFDRYEEDVRWPVKGKDWAADHW